jgi:hypothetical protein
MMEFQDARGRLVVVLPMRLRGSGRRFFVFRDGRYLAEFRSRGEACEYARGLAEGRIASEK